MRVQRNKKVKHLQPKGCVSRRAEVGFPPKYPCLKRVMEPTAPAGHRMQGELNQEGGWRKESGLALVRTLVQGSVLGLTSMSAVI